MKNLSSEHLETLFGIFRERSRFNEWTRMWDSSKQASKNQALVLFRLNSLLAWSLQTVPSVWRIDAAHAAPAARLCSALALTTGRSSYPVPS